MNLDKIVVPFIGGYNLPVGYVDEVRTNLSLDINSDIHLLSEAIDIVNQKKYDLILCYDMLFSGDFKLPNYVSHKDYVAVSCYFIEKVRKSRFNSDTNVIATINPNSFHVESKKYIIAGASDVFNLSHNEPEDLIDLVKRQL